jgi:hypothetical protein
VLHLAHLALCADLALWRATQATPSWSAVQGAEWVASGAGRALALASELIGVVALVAAVVATLRSGRDARAWGLLAALALALAWRAEIDAFDLAYAGLTVGLGAWWYRIRRPSLRERLLAT